MTRSVALTGSSAVHRWFSWWSAFCALPRSRVNSSVSAASVASSAIQERSGPNSSRQYAAQFSNQARSWSRPSSVRRSISDRNLSRKASVESADAPSPPVAEPAPLPAAPAPRPGRTSIRMPWLEGGSLRGTRWCRSRSARPSSSCHSRQSNTSSRTASAVSPRRGGRPPASCASGPPSGPPGGPSSRSACRAGSMRSSSLRNSVSRCDSSRYSSDRLPPPARRTWPRSTASSRVSLWWELCARSSFWATPWRRTCCTIRVRSRVMPPSSSYARSRGVHALSGSAAARRAAIGSHRRVPGGSRSRSAALIRSLVSGEVRV